MISVKSYRDEEAYAIEIDGVERGRYATPECMQAHLATALTKIDELAAKLAEAEAERDRLLVEGRKWRMEWEKCYAVCSGIDALVRERDEARQQLAELRGLLQGVYSQVGNHAPPHRRHVLTPGLRDRIRDVLYPAQPKPESSDD